MKTTIGIVDHVAKEAGNHILTDEQSRLNDLEDLVCELVERVEKAEKQLLEVRDSLGMTIKPDNSEELPDAEDIRGILSENTDGHKIARAIKNG